MRKTAIYAFTACATLAFTLVAGSAPAGAASNYATGTQYCAGGPTHYAGVRAKLTDKNGGSLIFHNLSTGKQVAYNTPGDGKYYTYYSPWSSARWEIALQDVSGAVGVCS